MSNLHNPLLTRLAVIACISFTMANIGCSTCRAIGIHGCDSHQSRQVVQVVGRVQHPTVMELGTSGLTIQRSLLIAGGAREGASVTAVPRRGSADAADTQRYGLAVRKMAECAQSKTIIENAASVTPSDHLGFRQRLLQYVAGVTEATPGQLNVAQEALARADETDDIANKRVRSRAIDVLVAVASRKKEEHEQVTMALEKRITEAVVGAFFELNQQIGVLQAQVRMEEQRLLKENLNGGADPNATLESQATKDLVAATQQEANLTRMLNIEEAQTITPSASTPPRLIVVLDRPSTRPPVKYHFPYELVLNGLASEIELRNGDTVAVMDITETDLAPTGGVSDNPNVVIMGRVKEQGIADVFQTLGAAHQASITNDQLDYSAWVVVRPAANGTHQNIYVLPDDFVQPSGVGAKSPLVDGDVLQRTTLPEVPIIVESFVRQGARACHGCAASHVERAKEKHDGKVELWGRMIRTANSKTPRSGVTR